MVTGSKTSGIRASEVESAGMEGSPWGGTLEAGKSSPDAFV